MTIKQLRQLLFDYWYLPAGLLLLGAILFGFDRCGDWRAGRAIDKYKANINAGLTQIAAKEQTISNLQTEVAVQKEAVKNETNTLLNSINATNEAKVATNTALANLDAAKNSNHTNSSVKDLEKALEGLE